MSSIDKMSISGIRSFSPEKPQFIQFYTPLTLILGPNGSGKTTIIECLRYITTGDMPPGISTFVHDPKIARESIVKAQVKLSLRNIKKEQYIITRSLEATQKVKSIGTRTLDNTIKRVSDETSISSKCMDTNKEMVLLLGVSKAILENVIFCHQEDSNWPLSEAKTLKLKFDDIFASTRYVKALDTIKKVRKSQHEKINMYTVEIKHFKQNKDKAMEIKSNLKDETERCATATKIIEDIDAKLYPINEKLIKLGDKEGEISKIFKEQVQMESEKGQIEKNAAELEETIQDLFQGSMEELKLALNKFEQTLTERADDLTQLQRDLDRVEQEVNRIGNDKSDVLLKQGKLEQEAERHRNNIKKRNDKIKRIAADYSIQGYSGRLEENVIADFIEDIGEKATNILQKAKDIRNKHEEEENKIEEEIKSERNALTKYQTEYRMKKDQMKQNEREIREINQKLNLVETSGNRLDNVKSDLRTAEQDLAEAESVIDIEAMEQDVKTQQKQKVDYDGQLKTLDGELNKMHLESSARTQLEISRKEMTKREEQMDKLKHKHVDTITSLLGSVPSGSLKKAIDDYVRDQSRKTDQSRDHIEKLNMKLSSKRQELRNVKEQLEKYETEKSKYENQIYEECEGENLDQGLSNYDKKIKKLQANKGLGTGTKKVFRDFIDKLRSKENAPCPLCLRCFDGPDEIEELVTQLEDGLSSLPERLEKYSRDLEVSEKKYNKLQQLKPLEEQVTNLNERTIPKLKEQEREIVKEVEKLTNEIEEQSDTLDVHRTDEATAKSVQPDMTLMEKYQQEIREFERKINQQQAKISGSDSDKTIQQVTTEREDLQHKLETINRHLDRKRQKISDEGKRLQLLKTNVNDLREDKLTIEKQLQERQQLENTKEELENKNEIAVADMTEINENLQPLDQRIKTLERKKKKVPTATLR